ncbi:hypothetical protein EJB05_14498, partial [Eragrostis curvula]
MAGLHVKGEVVIVVGGRQIRCIAASSPRRPRRYGTNFIDNEKDHHLTYFKRRSSLTKSSTDLSTFTGGKSAIVLESESGKKSAFGAPSLNAIMDSFLSDHNPNLDEGETAKITHLQDELFRLEKR